MEEQDITLTNHKKKQSCNDSSFVVLKKLFTHKIYNTYKVTTEKKKHMIPAWTSASNVQLTNLLTFNFPTKSMWKKFKNTKKQSS